MISWLNKVLKNKVRLAYEKDYRRKLTDMEIEQIAVNLTDFMEAFIKFKLKKYENKTVYS